MTMEFKAVHAALLQGIEPGDAIGFEFVERAPGEWVITAISKETKADGAGLAHHH
jgi:Cu(I)/Ag(I) efflux system membrane fusion protein